MQEETSAELAAIRPVWVEVDLEKIAHNCREVRRLVPARTQVMAVVKANAYGHGAVAVAKTALRHGATWLGVAAAEEGIQLRQAGITAPILILGLPAPTQAELIVRYELATALCTRELALALSQAAQTYGKPARVHLKVDTGMGRIGLYPEEVAAFLDFLQGLPALNLEGVFSHLATADSEEKTTARAQFARFQGVCATLSARGVEVPLRHLANSAAILDLPEFALDLVRPGIILYGYYPSPQVQRRAQLQPALTWKARLTYIKKVPAGVGLSYGHTYRTARSSWVGTVPAGYADGYSRLLSGKVEVLVGGRRVPVIGRICMDQCLVDLGPVQGGEAAPAAVGDEVVLLGRQGEEEISADELAGKLGTISYEVLCLIGHRVPRFHHL